MKFNRNVSIGILRRQIDQISEGGFPVLVRKFRTLLRRLLVNLPLFLLALLIVLLVRLLRPLILIRFGKLISSRIGHFAADAELYLCECEEGMQNPKALDIFYYSSPICNRQFKKMCDRMMYVFSFAKWLDRANRRLPGGNKHTIINKSKGSRDVYELLSRTQAHLYFTVDEEQMGRAALQNIGLPEGARFICFHSRDSTYLNAVWPNSNWHYHDYRDSTIHNYVQAIEALTRRGYYAFRIGALVKEALNTTNPMIIDYATNGSRTDFLDIYLSAKCHFFLGTTAGITSIPMIFRRPIAWVNYLPLEYVQAWSEYELFITKKLYLKGEHRFMTFREIFDSGAGRFLRSEQYEQIGVDVIENTSEEIKALAIEMDERLNGTWQTNEENEELQKRFWDIFPKSELHGEIKSHIGAQFLRQNRELLD